LKIKIITIFLIILLGISSTEFSVSEILVDSNLVSKNVDERDQPGKITKLNLSENASLSSGENDTRETPIFQPKILKLRLAESASLSSGDYDQEAISSIKADLERKAIWERIWNQERIRTPSKSISSLGLANTQNGLIYVLDENAFSTFWNDNQNLFSEFENPSIFEHIYNTASSQHLVLEDQNSINSSEFLETLNPSLLMVTIPLAGFALLRSETNGFEFYNFRRFSCYLFILILLSSGVFTPLSISSSYWPNAYAQEFDESVSVVPSNATSTEITEFDESVSIVPSNATSTEITEFDESISVVPSNATSTEITEFDESISVVPSNATDTEITEFDESISVVPSNATSTEITEFDESVSVVPSNATSTEITEFDESVSVVPSNATSTEITEFDESVSVVPTNSTLTEIQPLVELQVNPILTSVKDAYLISEDAVLELEFYNEYDVFMNELTQLDNAMQILTIDVNQTFQEIQAFSNSTSIVPTNQTSTEIQTSSNTILNFINILFSIPQADATKQTDEDASKIEIENAKAEIKKLKEQLEAIKEDPNLTEQELKEAKAQLKKVIDQIKSTADQITKTELKTEGAALKKSADDLEKVGGVESEDPIQTDNWVGTDETIVGEVYDPDGNAISLNVEYEKLRDGKFSISLAFDQNSKPGLYKLKTTLTVDGKTYVSEEEFAWGLVSLNTKKSIYRPGETAEFVIVVLDSEGHPVCDANLSMKIANPNSQILTLSSGNGISQNEECGLYDSQYTTSIEGAYTVDINAIAEGINTNFTTTFDVAEFFEFDIIRTAESKIDPSTSPTSISSTSFCKISV